jgi:2-hydroxy-3-keto-5-methylthiopentenyl-1-phosphate phosphatase
LYRVFCDFDATITVNDVWHVLFTKYGKPIAFEIWKEFGRGKKTAAECVRIACETVEGADPEEVKAMFEREPLRPGFVGFVKFCKEQDLGLTIISDGFTGYIRPILGKNNIDVPYYSNDIEVTEQGSLSIDFRYGRESCRHCAACKCANILTNVFEDDTIVYVGDGYSDTCPVELADVVFARDTLLAQCGKKGIPHHPFNDFFEVEAILKNYLLERPKYRREQARRRRKELFMIE